MKRPLAGEGEVAWRNYASSIEDRVDELHAEVVELQGRLTGIKSGLLLRITALERQVGDPKVTREAFQEYNERLGCPYRGRGHCPGCPGER